MEKKNVFKRQGKYLLRPTTPQDDGLTEREKREKAIEELCELPLVGKLPIIEREKAIEELEKLPLVGNLGILERERTIAKLTRELPLLGDVRILERERAIAELQRLPLVDMHILEEERKNARQEREK